MKHSLLWGVLAAALVLPGLVGCASTGAERAEKMNHQMTAQSTTVGSLQQNVDGMNQILNEMQSAPPQTDLASYKDRFSDQLDKIEDTKEKANDQYEDLTDARNDYVNDSRVELRKLSEPSLRSAAEARRNEIVSDFNTVSSSHTSMNTAYDNYMSDLKQIQAFLKTAAAQAGVSEITPAIQRALADGQSLNASAQAYQTALNQASGVLAPTATQP